MSPTKNANAWFEDAQIGMMVHWGVYSHLGRGEWVLNRERMPWDEYRSVADQWKAPEFSAALWADACEEMGARYFIFTAKHHDGFCLWNTQTTDFNSVKIGPSRDICGELCAEFRKRGLKIGFFFSLADWSHPAYPTPYAVDWPRNWKAATDRETMVAYALSQVEELCRLYTPDVMWFDGAAPAETPEDWRPDAFLETIRRHSPDCLVNNRLGRGGDFDALEFHLDHDGARPWESDYTLNDSWAWNPLDRNYKSPLTLWQRFLATRMKGGNLLLNLSPRGDGSLVEEERTLARQLGDRLRLTRYADYGVAVPQLRWMQGGLYSARANVLFVHVWYRDGDEVALAPCRNRVLRASLVDDNRELRVIQEPGGRVRMQGLAGARRNELGYCIRLELDGQPVAWEGHQDLNF